MLFTPPTHDAAAEILEAMTMGRPRKLPEGMWQRGGTYYARFRANGQEVRKRLSTDFEAAKTILNDLKARADKQDFGIVDNAYPWDDLKAEFLRWAKQAVRSPGDYRRDLQRLEKYMRVLSVRQITLDYAYGYREWRLAQTIVVRGKDGKLRDTGKLVCPRTVNKEVGTLRNMLAKGVAWKRIALNPLADLKPLRHDSPRKVRRALSGGEVEAIFTAAPDWLRPALRLFATTGIRHGELVELLFSDVDFERRTITVRAEIAKNHKAREISLDDDTLATLADQRDRAKRRQPVERNSDAFSRDHVFVTGDNTPLRNNLLRAFLATCRRAGIEGAEHGGSVDLHSLRVTFTTLAIDGGASPKAVQDILGHSTLAMTMGTYAKATEAGKRNAVAALPFVRNVSPPAGVISVPFAHKLRTSNSDDAKTLENKAI